MIDNNYCGIRGCGRPGEAQSDHEMSGLILRVWLCDQHMRDGGIPDALDLDPSRLTWLIKTARAVAAVS